MIYLSPSRADKEERFGQSSRDVGRGMQWTSRCRAREFSRADERCLADGEIVWSWRPWAGAKSADDDRQATVTMRSRTPGRARTTPLTPLRREGRVAPVE